MRFSFAVKTLDTRIKRSFEALDDCRRLYQEDGIDEPNLLETFDRMQQALDTLAGSLRETLAANERIFDIVGFLTDALKMEHHSIAKLQGFLVAIDDRELCDYINEMLVEEKKQEQAIANRIRTLGGVPQVPYKTPPPPTDISIVELMKQYRIETQRVQKHYELGLSRFKEPEFQWILGQLNVAEQEHLAKLDRIIEKYSSADVIPPELKNIKWVDPYMGKPGDRSWIE